MPLLVQLWYVIHSSFPVKALTLGTGPNTLTFIIPAEIFPTCYRSTCHGISAAPAPGRPRLDGYDNEEKQGLIFILFASFMVFGAVYSWAYLPDIQHRVVLPSGKRKLVNRNLEDLGEGRMKNKIQGEALTIRGKWKEMSRRREISRRRATRRSEV